MEGQANNSFEDLCSGEEPRCRKNRRSNKKLKREYIKKEQFVKLKPNSNFAVLAVFLAHYIKLAPHI